MEIDFSELSPNQRYHVMTQIVIPRPIAWVLTDNGGQSGERSFNLAPFSYFNALSSDPPLIVLSIGRKPEGEFKDTRKKILERKSLVVHIPSESDAELVFASSETLVHGDSEISKLRLELVEHSGWKLPRLRASKVAMVCHLYDFTEIGPDKQGVIFCQIDEVFIDDEVLTLDSKRRPKINAGAIAPLSRLGASEYASIGEVFTLARPK